MFSQLFDDLLNLARFRVKPLGEYRHPAWQLALLVTVMGVFSAAVSEDFEAPLLVKIGFFVFFEWITLLLLNTFFSWWLRQGDNWQGNESLWPLLVLANGVNLLTPVIAWFDAPFDAVVAMGLAIYSVVILINALTQATQVRRAHVIGGVLLFTPMAFILYVLVMVVASGFGWIPDVRN
ncbi:hypothetical protein ABWL39_16500 [Chitinivorax sp. PXF-14]|uniref:hypothetical protein n=1 Tax=Chitinivorax sp. PXF-14 TaxID=3230488 RepID=UPI00346601E1